jgi:hypothetical protein
MLRAKNESRGDFMKKLILVLTVMMTVAAHAQTAPQRDATLNLATEPPSQEAIVAKQKAIQDNADQKKAALEAKAAIDKKAIDAKAERQISDSGKDADKGQIRDWAESEYKAIQNQLTKDEAAIDAETAKLKDDADTGYKYAMVMSSGGKAHDKDLLLIRKQGKLYSFKYCRAFTPKGAVPELAQIRKDYFLNSSKYQDVRQNREILGLLFKSSLCETVGAPAYAMTGDAHLDERNFESDTGGATAAYSVGGAVLLAFSWINIPNLLSEIAQDRANKNTETTMRYFFSSSFPHGTTALTIGLIGAAAGAGYLAYQNHLENNTIDAMINGSYARFVSPNTVLVADSMDEFMQNFVKGLGALLKNKVFVIL